MSRNVEIKARVPELDGLRARARALTLAPSEVLEQTDTFFRVPRGRLKVREFADGSGELIFYQRPDESGPTESVYDRLPCPSARHLAEMLGAALPVRGAVVKRREVFLVGTTRIHLDQVEGLGDFLELEVVLADGQSVEHGQRIATELLGRLQIPPTALVAAAYIDLLEERRAASGFSGPSV